MFDQEFFPTPAMLIDRMLSPYCKGGRLPQMTVLEPSAGKGDIADCVSRRMNGDNWRRCSTEGIYCIEQNPELQSILREKGYAVIGDDFLRFTGGGLLFDLIVMNPPFSRGAAHLLHAWELLKAGDLVCILPVETLRNPCTRERQLLCELIEDRGGIVEEVGAAFKDAERKTGVEVCIIRLSKKDDSLIDGIFDDIGFARAHGSDEEAPLINENQVACRSTIRRMVDAYRATLDSFRSAAKALRELEYYGREFGSRFEADDERGNPSRRGASEAFCQIIRDGLCEFEDRERFASLYRNAFNRFAVTTCRAAWDSVFSQTEISRFMTKGVRDEFEKLQKSQRMIEFTEENIAGMLESLLMSGGKIREAAIVEAFDLITKYHAENRIHIEGWKSNDFWRANRRFILPCVVDFSFGSLSVCYNTGERLNDIDRALCLQEGIRFDEILPAAEAIRQSLREVEIGSKVSSHFFEIRYYKKGTGHFMFLDEGVWERFNIAASKGKNWLPGQAA